MIINKGTVLVTGCAGTTGSNLVPKLLDKGYYVIGVDNFFRGTPENMSSFAKNHAFSFFQCDLRDISYDKGWKFEKCIIDGKEESFKLGVTIEYIINLGAIVPTHYFYDSPDLTYEVNCAGAIKLFNEARKARVKKFVDASSSEIYGHMDDHIPCKESDYTKYDAEEVTTRWSYALGKLLCEHYMNHFKNEMIISHLRFANVYGPKDLDDNHVIPYLINNMIQDKPIHINKDANKFYRTFLHEEDSANAVLCVLENNQNSGTAFNVGSKNEVSIRTLVDTIWWRYSLNPLYEGDLTILDLERVGDPHRRVLDTSRLESLGWRSQVSLEQGLDSIFLAVSKKNKRVR